MTTLLTIEDEVFNDLALQKELEDQTLEPPFNPNSQVERNKAQELALATGEPVDSIEAEREAGDNRAEVIAKTDSTSFDYGRVIDSAYNEGLSVEDVAQIIEERKAKGEDMSIKDYILMQNLMLSDNEINAYAARTLTNMEVWNRLLQKEIEADDTSNFSKVISFLDVNVLRELTIGAFENVTFRSNREGKDIREAFNSLRPDEFEDWAKEYIAERKTEGYLGNESIWNLYKAANDATYLGDDPMAGLNFLFGAADLASLGTTKIVSTAVKGLKTGATAASSAPSKLLDLYRSRRAVDVVATIEGEVSAAKAATKLTNDAGVQTDEVMAGRHLPQDLDPTPSPSSRPSGVTLRDGNRKTILTEKLEEINRRGSFGEYIPRPSIEATATRIAEDIATKVNDVVVNTRHVVDEGSDDFKVVVRLGKDGSGAPFRRKMDAEAIAATDPRLKVIKKETGRGWFIETEERINVLGLPKEADKFSYGSFVSEAVNRVFGAATVRLGDKIGGKFLQAEAGQALVGDLVKPYQKLINKVKSSEATNLSDFMTQLRDGELSYLRQAPDKTSFESLYKTMYGEKPSKAAVDAYEALLDISDTTWQIKASERLKRVVAEGGVYVDVTDDFGGVGYRVDSVPADELVLDIAANKSTPPSSLKPDTPVFKMQDPLLDHIYVTNVKSTRVLERVDVMPYNVGGPRTNSEFRWFVGSTKEQRLASGNMVSTGFKTLLGSFGKQQAETAVREINSITRAVKNLLDEAGLTDIADLNLSKAEYDKLGDTIRANNTWNRHVTDLEDLQDLAAKYNFRFTEEFVAKARDQKVSIREAGQDSASVGASFADVVGSRINMKRNDTPLMEFGGKRATNASPVSTIADQFGSEVFGYTNRAASQNAIVGWVKLAEKAEGLVTFPKGVPENDFFNRFLQAEVAKTGKFNDLAAQLREQQEVLKRRLNQPTYLSDKWESFTSSATEAIFEKSGFKLDLTKTDPSSRLLQVGFYSKFGFFNPDQFMLQGLHSLTIAAISPKQGFKAMGLVTPLLAVSKFTDEATRSLALQRLSKVPGFDAEEFKQLLRYIDESGRNIIDNQIIELQAPQKFGAASTLAGKSANAVGKFLDKSTLFFKEGERLSRLVGITTAFLEHRAKRPNIDPFSAEGRLWITNREQDLTFRMTTSSRSYVQSGPMRVPTQWLTFSMRALENIAIGRNFTVSERIGMAFVMGPMFGLTGLGAGKSAGYVVEKLGYDPQDPDTVKVFNRIKYGMVDAVLSNLLGTETAYANRVAPLGQIQDTYKKLFEESLVATLFGPSGEISSDMLAVASNAIEAMVGGQTQMVRDDLTQLVRNLSTVDKVVKVRELIETGNYRSRTSKLAVSGLDEAAAAAVLFGATPAPVQNFYDYNEMVFSKNKEYRDFSKRVKQKATLALDLLTNGDKDDMIRGTKLWEEISDEIWSSRFSGQLKTSLQRSVVNVAAIPDIMKNALRLGLDFDARTLSQQLR